MMTLLKRNLLLFAYALAFWLFLITLDVTLGFNGMIAGLLYWISLIVLFLALWYANLSLVQPLSNEALRFFAIMMLAMWLTVVFIFFGYFVGVNYKLYCHPSLLTLFDHYLLWVR